MGTRHMTLVALSLLMIVTQFGCSSPETKKNRYRSDDDDDRPLVDSKYSLTADRQKLAELRAEIPPEKRQENDELALMAQMSADTSKKPADVREEFDKIVRKKRELFDKDMKREREDFTKKERKSRDEFMKEQTDQKEAYRREKHPREESQNFYRELDAKRVEFFSNERDKRGDYESDARERRKNFEDYVRSKTNEFNQEHRAYVKRYDEAKKLEREKKAENPTAPGQLPKMEDPTMPRSFLQDLMDLDQVRGQGTNLESGE